MTSLHDPAAGGPSSVAMLRRRLDQAVAAAWAVRLVGWLGRVAVIDLAIAIVVALVASASGGAVVPMIRAAILLATPPAALVTWWMWSGDRPTRLAVAQAAEAANPILGERLSRAVEWLDAADEAAPPSRLSIGLRQLALENAVAAGIDRLPMPGLGVHGPWILAGGIACAVLLAAPREPRSPIAGRPAAESPAAVMPEIVDAGERLARAAAIETRLADILLESFAAAPGVIASALADGLQKNLAALAAVQRDTLDGVALVRERLAAGDSPAARAAVAMLEPAAGIGSDVAAAIADNRLAIAAAEAARLAELFRSSAAILGMPTPATPAGMPSPESPVVVEARRVEAALDRIEARLRGEPRPAAGTSTAAATPPRAADGDRMPAGSTAVPSSSVAESSPGGMSSRTTAPGFAAGEAETLRPDAAAEALRERVWSLLPAGSRPSVVRGSAADAPPEYRAAVDLYYQLLLESLASERKAGRQP